MEEQQQREKSRVVKVDSEESWNLSISQANNQGSPVFVHFSASWCVPSLAMNSYFEELAKTYQDIVFLLVDVDELKGVASKMEVKAMPTFVLMRDGAVITKIVGANPGEMKKRIDAFAHSLSTTSTLE
ncbi:thioredoxin-like protein CXXS1 [Cocos nucifera]|uniref:Thioredoxin-like protein CXXS1 n=1 Tax=Cocos nucifera TaxID=13894 RepID=A0A8K0IRC9_COCNU|nr:thioredoxin-like protein CXXS1 [Cocos nucifera]